MKKFQKNQKAEDQPWQKADLEEIVLNGVKPTDDSEKYGYKRIKLGKYGMFYFLSTTKVEGRFHDL